MNRPPRIALILLDTFLALTAIGGGIALVAGCHTPPVALLMGSPFRSYLLPGLALAALVGGSAALAVTTVVCRHRSALPANLGAAVAVIVFEVVEIAAIGSPKGPARNMQILYLSLGMTIAAIAIFARSVAVPHASGSTNLKRSNQEEEE